MAQKPLQPGETFERYVIEAPLGSGGMGEVYRAYDPKLRRKIALKVLLLEGRSEADTNAAAERILREGRAAAALDHPNAVSVFDVGEVDGRPFIVMELVQGVSLRDYVGDPSISYDRRVRWLTDIARALAAAHERGLVHRDVKPENVMIRDDGVVKVLDFGIAKHMVVDKDHPSPSVVGTAATIQLGSETVRGALLGTPRYFAPEQVTSDPVDGRTDQFAWGVMAYELLSGRAPWNEADGVLKLMNAITTVEPPNLAQLIPNLPIAVSRTVALAMSKSPSRRFPDMGEVIASLEPFEATSLRSLSAIAVTSSRRAKVASEAEHSPTLQAAAHPMSGSPRTLSGHSPRTWLLAAGGAAAVTAALVAALRAESRPPSVAPAVPRPTGAVTDLPLPKSESLEAISAYRAGMQAFRDGTFAALRQNLNRAVTLDPGLAAAHLRLSVFDSLVELDESEGKRSYRRATQQRVNLGEHDQLLLEALEPYFMRDPSDPAECERRLRAAAERFPEDAELWFYLGIIRYDRGILSGALEALNKAIEIDRSFALAWANKGGILAYFGDFDGAIKALDECMAISPQATEASWYRSLVFEHEGACSRAEAEARSWISKDPEDIFAYSALTRALLAEGKPREAIRAAFEQKWAHITGTEHARRVAGDEARFALYQGDFDDAERFANELERLSQGEPSATLHAEPARILVEVYRETGQIARAKDLADRYLKRRDAWEPASRVDDTAIESDPIPEMLGALHTMGALDDAAFEARRRDWITAWETKTGGEVFSRYLWVYGYALPAETPEDAVHAMEALPKYQPLPRFLPQSSGFTHVGRTYLLGGDATMALPYLKKATTSCMAMYRPFAFIRAYLSLGDALAQKGDNEGACDAYASVVERWGHDARSVTAKAARAHRAPLHCR